MIIKNENKFKPAPKGLHNAVCVDIVDLGMVTGKYGVKHKLRIVWEIEALIEDEGPMKGKRFLVMKSYGATIGPKSNLRKDLESWRDRKFTSEEAKELDLEKIIGVSAQLFVVHNQTADSTYANVQAVMPAKEKLAPSGTYKRVKDREGYQAPNLSVSQEAAVGPDLENDDIPF